MNYSREIVKIVFYLIAILGLIYISAYFLKKWLTRQGSGSNIQLIERFYLSSKKSLMLIKVHDKVLLIGITENGIDELNKWDAADFKELKIEDGQDFKDYFQDFIKKYRRDGNE